MTSTIPGLLAVVLEGRLTTLPVPPVEGCLAEAIETNMVREQRAVVLVALLTTHLVPPEVCLAEVCLAEATNMGLERPVVVLVIHPTTLLVPLVEGCLAETIETNMDLEPPAVASVALLITLLVPPEALALEATKTRALAEVRYLMAVRYQL